MAAAAAAPAPHLSTSGLLLTFPPLASITALSMSAWIREACGERGAGLQALLGTSQSEAAYLHLVTLEEVQVGFALTRVLADQSQEGGEDAGVHQGLDQLHAAHREPLQLLLRGASTERVSPGTFWLPVHLCMHATLESGSRRPTLFSSTCSTISCVHTFPLASSSRRRLTPSSTPTIPSLRSSTNVVRCCSRTEPSKGSTHGC